MDIFNSHFQPYDFIEESIPMYKHSFSCLFEDLLVLEDPKALSLRDHAHCIEDLDSIPLNGDIYISPIQRWIEVACKKTCLIWKELVKLIILAHLHDCKHISKLVIAPKHAYLMMYYDEMLRWLH